MRDLFPTALVTAALGGGAFVVSLPRVSVEVWPYFTTSVSAWVALKVFAVAVTVRV